MRALLLLVHSADAHSAHAVANVPARPRLSVGSAAELFAPGAVCDDAGEGEACALPWTEGR